MTLYDDLLAQLPDGLVREVRISLYWTAVVAEVDGETRCGLASTLLPDTSSDYADSDVKEAGKLTGLSARVLAEWVRDSEPPRSSIGMAAINALLPRTPEAWTNIDAEEIIAEHGADRTVALVGNFPFVPRLEKRVGRLMVLEQQPAPGQYPAEAAPEIIPQADVVAITSMTLLNHTLPDLLTLLSPQALVLMLGPTTPLSPVLFDHGIDIIAGSVVMDIPLTLQTICEGAKFRQVRQRGGMHLVAMRRPPK